MQIARTPSILDKAFSQVEISLTLNKIEKTLTVSKIVRSVRRRATCISMQSENDRAATHFKALEARFGSGHRQGFSQSMTSTSSSSSSCTSADMEASRRLAREGGGEDESDVAPVLTDEEKKNFNNWDDDDEEDQGEEDERPIIWAPKKKRGVRRSWRILMQRHMMRDNFTPKDREPDLLGDYCPMHKEGEAEADGARQLQQPTTKLHYYRMTREHGLYELIQCALHNSLNCPYYQIGFRLENIGSVICLQFTSARNIENVQAFFIAAVKFYVQAMKSGVRRRINPNFDCAEAMWTRRMFSDESVFITSQSNMKILDLCDWLAYTMINSEDLRLTSEYPIFGHQQRAPFLFSKWKTLNSSPLTKVVELKRLVELPRGRWHHVPLNKLSLYKCERAIAEVPLCDVC